MTFGTREWTPSRVIKLISTQDGERVERRRFSRVKMELPGRYLTPNGEEHDCATVDFSPSGVRFRTLAPPPPLGANIIAYVRDLGRLQGSVARRMKDGFAIALAATELKIERLSQKIAWLQPEGAPDRRLFPRVAPAGALIPVRCADGRSELAPIIDVSTSGIAFRIGIALKIGEQLEIGDMQGVVVRLFEGGAAVKFI